MKARNTYGALALAGALLAACAGRLDIEPQASIDATTALTNAQNVESAVVGTYSIMGDGDLYGTNLLLLADLLADQDYIRWRGTFQGYRELANKTANGLNSEAARTWRVAYEAINVANNVLDALAVVDDEELRGQLEGEALFVRGVMYFELVRLYALPWNPGDGNGQAGVPLVLRATETAQQAADKQPRASVAQVYERVIDDLTRARTLLPAFNAAGRATTYAASAFLSRVYLQQSRYAEALAEADRIIDSDNFRLTPSVAAVFTNRNTQESVFEIQQNDQNNAGESNDGMATFYASKPGLGRGDVDIRGAFLDLFDEDDARITELTYEGTGRRSGTQRTSKWFSPGQNLSIVRLAELLLTRAEANLRLNSAVGAAPLDDVNRVRTRAGLSPLGSVTLEAVLDERFKELAFEGHRVHDLKRLQSDDVDRVPGPDDDDVLLGWQAPELVLPIPQREIDVIGELSQNAGY